MCQNERISTKLTVIVQRNLIFTFSREQSMSGQTERAAAAGGKQASRPAVGLEPWTGEGSGEKRERGGVAHG
jgi:hypothetical protein